MKEDILFIKLIKKFPSTFITLLIIIVSLAIPGVLYLIDSESFAEDSTFEISQIIIIILVILAIALVIDFIINIVKKYNSKVNIKKKIKQENEEQELNKFVNKYIEKVEDDVPFDNEKVKVIANNQNDLDYVAITNWQIVKEDSIPDNLNDFIKKDNLYYFKSEGSNLYVELFINNSRYKFKIDCSNIKQLFLTTVNQIMIPYSLTIICNDDSRLVIRDSYGSNLDNFNRVVEYIKSLNSSTEVINEFVFEGNKVSFGYGNPLVLNHKYSIYRKDISNRVINHDIENIPIEDIKEIEYSNHDVKMFSCETNYLKIYTNKCIYVILYDRKIDNLIQNLNYLPLKEVNNLVNRKWYFGKDDNGALYKYYDNMKEKDEYEDLNVKYRLDTYNLNEKTDELNLSKSYSSLRKDGTSFNVTFYYNTNGFNKYDIKSNGQIMLLQEGDIGADFIEFIDYDCYEVERFSDVGDNLYVNTNYAYIYNTSREYLVGFDIFDIKTIEHIRDNEDDYVINEFKIYTKDGSMILYVPLMEYGGVDDIINTFLIINPDIIINRS